MMIMSEEGKVGSIKPQMVDFLWQQDMLLQKLNPLGYVEWNAACSSCFDKVFNNGQVSGINHDMKPIQGGAVMVGYGSEDWE